MALLGTYKQSVQQDAPGLAQAESPAVAGVRGESISQFAQGLGNLGAAMLERERAEERTRKQLAISDFENYAKDAKDTAENHAYSKARADYGDLDSLALESYDKAISERMKTVTDKGLLDYFRAKAGDVRNDLRGKILDDKRKGFAEFATRAYGEELNKKSARILMKPDVADEEIASYEELIAFSAMAGPNKAKAIHEGKKVLAKSAISSHVAGERWEEAQRASLKYASLFDQEEQIKNIREIKDAENKAINLNVLRENQDQKRAEREHKQSQEATFESLLKEVYEFKVSPKGEAISGAQVIQDKIDAEFSLGKLSSDQQAILEKFHTKRNITREQERNTVPFYARLASEDVVTNNRLMDDVYRAARNGELSPESFRTLTNAIRSERRIQEREGRSTADPRVKTAVDFIKGMRPYDPTNGYRKVEDSQYINTMLGAFWDARLANPKAHPMSLARSIVKSHSGANAVVNPKFYTLINSENPAQAAKEALKLRKLKKISEDDLNKVLLELKSKLQQQQETKERKNGTK